MMNFATDEDDAERQAFLPRNKCADEESPSETNPSTSQYYRHYLRLALEISMAIIILILSIRILHDEDDEKSSPSAIPNCMSKIPR